MTSDGAGIMDDSGFSTAFGAGTDTAPPRDLGLPAAPRRPGPTLDRRWGFAAAVVLVGHASFLTAVGLNRGPEVAKREILPAILYLDLTPITPVRRESPAAHRTPPAKVARQVAAPTPPPAFTSRPALEPPPQVEPLPAPPPVAARPAAAAPAAQATPAAPPAAGQTSTPSPEFQRKVLAALERVRRYPPAARARREEGTVVVSFTMNRQGRVLSAAVQQGSGSPTLDRAALETVRRAALPPVPAEFADPLRLILPVEFSVGGR